MKSNTHKIMTIAVLWFRLYLHVKLEKQHNICVFNWKRCWTEQTQREKDVCVRWDSKTSRSRGSTSESQKLNKVWANPKVLSFLKRVKKRGLQSR